MGSLLPSSIGSFNHQLKACQLDERFVLDVTIPVEMIAACIVHEATHARLFRCGIGYEVNLRERIEAACFRQELAFAAKLPNGEYVRDQAQRAQSIPPAYWVDAAFNERDIDGSNEILRHLGIPGWLASSICAAGRWSRRLRRDR